MAEQARIKGSPWSPRTRSPAPTLGPRAIRTRTLLADTARDLFLHRGYGGVRIDDIVETAGVSRASFYTYFPSKKDILLAIGQDSYAAARENAELLAKVPDDWTRGDIADWVMAYIDFLEEHGSFVAVWTQAAWDDEELRSTGMRTQLAIAHSVGRSLQRLRRGAGTEHDAALEGLAIAALYQRLWQLWRASKAPFSRRQIVDVLTDMTASWLERS